MQEVVDDAQASARSVKHHLTCARAVTPELTLKLGGALGSSADTWLRMQNATDLARVQQRGG